MRELKELRVTGIHAVERAANKRRFLLVKSENPETGGNPVTLTNEAVSNLQKMLDTPVDGEDALWAKFGGDLGADAEVPVRTAIRLLKGSGANGKMSLLLKEAGFTEAEPEKPKAPAALPDAVVEMVKSAGFEAAIKSMKSAEGGDVIGAITPLLIAMSTEVKSLRETVQKFGGERATEKVRKSVEAMGFAGPEADSMVALLADKDEDYLQKFGEAMAPVAKRDAEAKAQLLAEKGTATRTEEGTSALAEVQKRAREMVTKGEAEDPLEAERKVLDSDPALYQRYRQESYSEQKGEG